MDPLKCSPSPIVLHPPDAFLQNLHRGTVITAPPVYSELKSTTTIPKSLMAMKTKLFCKSPFAQPPKIVKMWHQKFFDVQSFNASK